MRRLGPAPACPWRPELFEARAVCAGTKPTQLQPRLGPFRCHGLRETKSRWLEWKKSKQVTKYLSKYILWGFVISIARLFLWKTCFSPARRWESGWEFTCQHGVLHCLLHATPLPLTTAMCATKLCKFSLGRSSIVNKDKDCSHGNTIDKNQNSFFHIICHKIWFSSWLHVLTHGDAPRQHGPEQREELSGGIQNAKMFYRRWWMCLITAFSESFLF